MLTEANKSTLMNDIGENVDYNYLDFNTGSVVFLFRSMEPVDIKLPAVMMKFLPTRGAIVDGLNHYIRDESGYGVFGYGELEPLIITVYTNQICKGTGTIHSGKYVADDYITKIERRIRRYWPKILWDMEAQIRESISFDREDISQFLRGTERQGYELTLYICSTRKWDYKPDTVTGDAPVFEDACLSGADQASYDAEGKYSTIFSVSGEMSE